MASSSSKPRRVLHTQAERSESTQQRIVDSAKRLIYKNGFQKANLQNIAQGARVTLGAVQHQFGTRQVLMERVINDVMAPFGDRGVVWPEASSPLPDRAREFLRRAWDHIYGEPSYVAAWGLFFGCKSTPQLFKRIDAKRAEDDPLFLAHFLSVFPEIVEHHPEPEALASLVFAALRGMALARLFPIGTKLLDGQLECLGHVIVAAGSPLESEGPTARKVVSPGKTREKAK